MKTTLLFVFCMIAILPACKEEETPHLPREKMVEVMTDIHLAEVYSTMVNDSAHRSVNKNMDSLAKYYKTILHHHDITMEEFKSSLEWYTENPKELDSVYVNVLNEISTFEGLMNATPPAQ